MPRLTKKVFVDLAIWMLGFGLLTGIAFPFFLLLIGVPETYAWAHHMIVVSIAAGLLVAIFNFLLVRFVVRPRLSTLAERMQSVERAFVNAIASHHAVDEANIPQDCQIDVDSEDEIGDSARAFNRMIDALKRSREFSRAAQHFSTAMASDLDLESISERALTVIRQHCGVDAGAIFVEQEGELKLTHAYAVYNAEALTSDRLLLQTMRQQNSVHIQLPTNVQIDVLLTRFRPQEILIVPICYTDRAIGIILLASIQPLAADGRKLALLFQQGLALALNNAMTHNQLQHIAAMDALTGTYNRRFGMQRLREEFGRAQRGGAPLGVMMLDIDHFKSVNDTYGHMVGDRMLISVAKAAQQAQREGDILVRYGGEEFLIILPGANCADCDPIAERLLRAVQGCEIMENQKIIRVTISIGFVAYPDINAETHEQLVSMADEALYRAKHNGRNRAESICPIRSL